MTNGLASIKVVESTVSAIPFFRKNPRIAATQLETGHKMTSGDDNECTKKASLTRGILVISVNGYIIEPTVRLLK